MMNKRAIFLCITLWISLIGTAQNGIKKYIPSEENLEARKWFETARFGLFIHWGVYSILGDGEWVMNKKNIPKETYEIYLHYLIQLNLMHINGLKQQKMRE